MGNRKVEALVFINDSLSLISLSAYFVFAALRIDYASPQVLQTFERHRRRCSPIALRLVAAWGKLAVK